MSLKPLVRYSIFNLLCFLSIFAAIASSTFYSLTFLSSFLSVHFIQGCLDSVIHFLNRFTLAMSIATNGSLILAPPSVVCLVIISYSTWIPYSVLDRCSLGFTNAFDKHPQIMSNKKHMSVIKFRSNHSQLYVQWSSWVLDLTLTDDLEKIKLELMHLFFAEILKILKLALRNGVVKIKFGSKEVNLFVHWMVF